MTVDNKESKVTKGSKEVKGGVAATGTVGRRVRHDITKQCFEAARYFADCAASMDNESQKAGLQDEIETSQHRAYVVGEANGVTSCLLTFPALSTSASGAKPSFLGFCSLTDL